MPNVKLALKICFPSLASYLDLRTLLNLLQTCKEIRELELPFLWKQLLLRDFPYFLITIPNETRVFSKENLKNVKETENEALLEFPPDYKHRLQASEETKARETLEKISNFKGEYQRIYKKTFGKSLDGLWIGDYLAHGNEKVRILHNGYYLWAYKITGDSNIPAKKLTFKVNLNENLDHGQGVIHLADAEYKNSRWGPVEVLIINENKIIVGAYHEYQEKKWMKVSLGFTKLVKGEETPFMSAKFEILDF